MADAPHVLILEARFYRDIADELRRGAIATLEAAGATYEVASVPGALELPAALAFALQGQMPFDGFVILGCVIRGETGHYDVVVRECARRVIELAVHERLALGFGVLTVENDEQAWERARVDRQNKGGDAAAAALAMVSVKQRFSS